MYTYFDTKDLEAKIAQLEKKIVELELKLGAYSNSAGFFSPQPFPPTWGKTLC